MSLRILTTGVAFVAVICLATGWVVSRDRARRADNRRFAAPIVNEHLLGLAGEPGQHHARLNALVGTWNVAQRTRLTPDAPWTTLACDAAFEWRMGGRFLFERLTDAESRPEPYDSTMILGYDNVRAVHTMVWMESRGTGILVGTGACDPAGNVITFFSETADPATGEPRAKRITLHFISPDRCTVEVFETGPDGREFKSRELTYTRTASSS